MKETSAILGGGGAVDTTDDEFVPFV